MSHSFFYFFLLIFLFLSCGTTDKTNIAADSNITYNDSVIKNGNSLMWRIEGKDIQTSYMYGTMHMIDPEYFNFTEKLEEKIENADQVVLEIGGTPSPFEAFNLMRLDSGKVHDYFTPEQLIEVLEFMDKEVGVSPKEFDQLYGSMKPFFIVQSISKDYFAEDARSYDLEIMTKAKETNTPIIGLETVSEQLGYFDQITQEEMAEMIITGIRNHDKDKKQTQKLMKLYSQQKVDKLIPLLQKQSPEFMEYADIFLYGRNKKWTPQIIDEMKTKSLFIAVGAGHLFGEDGLIDLLEKEGYTLTAVSIE